MIFFLLFIYLRVPTEIARVTNSPSVEQKTHEGVATSGVVGRLDAEVHAR